MPSSFPPAQGSKGVPEEGTKEGPGCGLSHSRGSWRDPQMPALALPLEPLCPRESERLLVRGVGAPGLRAGPAPEKPGEVRAHSAPPGAGKGRAQ